MRTLSAYASLCTDIMLKGVMEMFKRGVGSRGSHCILAGDGEPMHPKLIDPDTGKPYAFRPENEALRATILRLAYDAGAAELFTADDVPVRPVPQRDIAFEPAWTEYREGRIFELT